MRQRSALEKKLSITPIGSRTLEFGNFTHYIKVEEPYSVEVDDEILIYGQDHKVIDIWTTKECQGFCEMVIVTKLAEACPKCGFRSFDTDCLRCEKLEDEARQYKHFNNDES